MVSVRIEAETPEEVAGLLRRLVTGSRREIVNAVMEHEKELYELLADAVERNGDAGRPPHEGDRVRSTRRCSEAGKAALRSKAETDYRAARERLDEIRASEATRDSDAERRDTSA